MACCLPRSQHPIKNSKIPRGLPSTFDPRGQGILAPIRDQGWCPTSWAISTADVASDRWTKMSKSNQQPVTLAPQDLVCHTRGQRGCAGGHTDRAWKYLTKRGQVPGSSSNTEEEGQEPVRRRSSRRAFNFLAYTYC